MAERQYKGPEVTEDMKAKYRVDAERQYRNSTVENLEKEYKKLIRGKSPWEWLKEKVGSFVNMVKIAALSVFLGRQETAKRVNSGNREGTLDQLKKEAQTEAKINAIEEKLNELSKGEEKTPEDKMPEDKILEDKTLEDNTPEDKTPEDKTPEDKTLEDKTPEDRRINLDKNETILGQQTKEMTEKYREGLRDFLELQTGISKEFIEIQNKTIDVKDKNDKGELGMADSFIHVRFNVDAPEVSEYSKGLTMNHRGNTIQGTATAKALAQSVMYYTSEVYRDAKNNTHFSGTTPSKELIERYTLLFLDVAQRQKEEISNFPITMYGHQLEYKKEGNKVLVAIDGKEINFPENKWSIDVVHKAFQDIVRDKEIGDYAKIHDVSNELRAQRKSEISEAYCKKYSFDELKQVFEKNLDDFIKDGGAPTRTIDFHGNQISITINQNLQCIEAVYINQEEAYMDIRGKQDNDKIAGHIAGCLSESLDKEGMYLVSDIVQNFEDSISFTNDDIQTRQEVGDYEHNMELDDRDDDLSL